MQLDLTQERRDGAETWVLYSTSIDYLTIIIWARGGPGLPTNPKGSLILRCSSINGGVPTFMSLTKRNEGGLTSGDSNKGLTAPHPNSQGTSRVSLLGFDLTQKK